MAYICIQNLRAIKCWGSSDNACPKAGGHRLHHSYTNTRGLSWYLQEPWPAVPKRPTENWP